MICITLCIIILVENLIKCKSIVKKHWAVFWYWFDDLCLIMTHSTHKDRNYVSYFFYYWKMFTSLIQSFTYSPFHTCRAHYCLWSPKILGILWNNCFGLKLNYPVLTLKHFGNVAKKENTFWNRSKKRIILKLNFPYQNQNPWEMWWKAIHIGICSIWDTNFVRM